MRHTFGLLLGLLLTPALVYGSAWGHSQALEAVDPVQRELTDSTRAYGAFALLAAVGLVVGVVVVARWASPLASLVPAVALIGLSAYYLVDPSGALDLPNRVPPAGDLDDGLRTLLTSGLLGLLGLALFAPAWAPHRWRGDDDGWEEEEEE